MGLLSASAQLTELQTALVAGHLESIYTLA
jgi:hypothetical protein